MPLDPTLLTIRITLAAETNYLCVFITYTYPSDLCHHEHEVDGTYSTKNPDLHHYHPYIPVNSNLDQVSDLSVGTVSVDLDS
jgi:hypothetical protein